MNTKFFFSAIAMFAITSAANALPIGRDGKPRVNEEVATSAVVRRAEAVRVNEEVATSAVIKGVRVTGVNEEVATRVGTSIGLPIISPVSDTEKPMEVAIYHPLRH